MTAKSAMLSSLGGCLALVALSAQPAIAADAEVGKRVALARCSPCHIVVPSQREELANAPPFAVIARNADFDAEALAYAILSPHPGMNMTLTRAEADNIAAYIATLR